MRYVDGFVFVIPKKNVPAFVKIAKLAGAVWKEHGALQYCESVGNDLSPKMPLTFPKVMKLKKSETIGFSWIVFKSKAHRDRVNAKVMKDPRLAEMCHADDMPFDIKRMCYGGFEIVVDE